MTNKDGSVDVWFGPTLPQGVNPADWAQTVPADEIEDSLAFVLRRMELYHQRPDVGRPPSRD